MIYWLLHGFVGAILLRAGMGKLLHVRDFYWQVRSAAFFPRRLEPLVAFAIPALEVVAGCGVLAGAPAGWWPDALAFLLLASFAGYALWIAVTGRTIRCFCFGRDDGDIGWATVARNLTLVCSLAASVVCPPPELGLLPVTLSVTDGLTASLIFIAVFQLYSIRREFEKA